MNLKSISDCEQNKLSKLINYKFPNHYMKIGWAGFSLSFFVLISTKIFDADTTVLVEILKRLMLVFLMIVVLSKEKVEDEMIKTIRAQSFSIAFIAGIAYTLVQPIINFIVGFFLNEDMSVFEELGDFQVLWFLLIIYLVVFNKLKKRS